MNLAYDYSDGVVSEYIGLYLDDNPGCKWGDLLEQLTNQYSDYTSATDAARTLIKIKQREGETFSELASRVLGLAKVAYKDAVQREGEAVQAQLAEYYTDAIENTFVREDTARAAPASLAEAFTTTGKSLRLYNRLTASQGRGWPGETRTRWAETPPVAWDQGGSGHSGYRWRDHPHERGWRRPLPDPKQPGCWECGQLGHMPRECPRMGCTLGGRRLVGRVAQSYGLFGQDTEIICEVEIVKKNVKALLDTGASISMIRQKDLLELGFRCKDLKPADLRVVQADGRGMKISGMICLLVMVGEVVTMQTLYVATTLCRSMILGRDWLEGNKAHMSFNPVMLKLGGKEILLENCMNKESIVVIIEDLVIRPRTAISCQGKLSPTEEQRRGTFQITHIDDPTREEGEVTLCESVVEVGGEGQIAIMLANTAGRGESGKSVA